MKKQAGVKRRKPLRWLILVLSLFLIFNIILLIVYLSGGSLDGLFDSLTTKLVCKNQQYATQEYYQEQSPYDSYETYYTTVHGQDCDYSVGCSCTANHWFFGWCTDCSCAKQRTVTKYETVTKSRTITKYADVCLKVRKWKTLDYNINWLDEPEIYDQNGNPTTKEQLTS